MPQRRDNARAQVLAHRNSCCRSVELSRLHYHTARLICNCIVYTYFHKVPDLLSGFRVNGIAVFATNFTISIALQIICVANCDAIPVKLLPDCTVVLTVPSLGDGSSANTPVIYMIEQPWASVKLEASVVFVNRTFYIL